MSNSSVDKLFNGKSVKEDMILYSAHSRKCETPIGKPSFHFSKYKFKYFKSWSGKINDISTYTGNSISASVEEMEEDSNGNVSVYPISMSLPELKYCGTTKKEALEALKQLSIDILAREHHRKMQSIDHAFEYAMDRALCLEKEIGQETLELTTKNHIIDMEMTKY